jgi:predicted metal-dependent enzyme (double-stranded beta helix superfamily)
MNDKPKKLDDFCRDCSEGLAGLEDNDARIDFVTSIFEPLLADTPLFREILENVREGHPYPDVRHPTMFDNELILHRDPAGRFSLRMFLWPPGSFDPVHDHNSWGVIGPVNGRLKVRDFRRRDEDDAAPGYFTGVMEIGRRIILPGMSYRVLPLNEGIHQTGNPTDATVIQVSIYGKKQSDRPYINIYDEASGRIYPLYSPPVRKRMLAELALEALGNTVDLNSRGGTPQKNRR